MKYYPSGFSELGIKQLLGGVMKNFIKKFNIQTLLKGHCRSKFALCVYIFSKIQLVVYCQCCILIG